MLVGGLVVGVDDDDIHFIKAFADKCLTESCGRIDYLILNAGIMDISSYAGIHKAWL